MKQFIIDLIVVASIALIVGTVVYTQFPITKYVEVERIEYVDVIKVVPQYVEVERIVEVELIREVPVVKYMFLGSGYDFTYSDNETMSAYEALVWIDGGIRSHQYYIDNPQFQNKGTGDTAFQERTIAQYLRARSLIEKLIGEKISNQGGN